MYLCAVLKFLGEEVETKLDNTTSSSSESNSDSHNDDKISLSNADEIYPPAKRKQCLNQIFLESLARLSIAKK